MEIETEWVQTNVKKYMNTPTHTRATGRLISTTLGGHHCYCTANIKRHSGRIQTSYTEEHLPTLCMTLQCVARKFKIVLSVNGPTIDHVGRDACTMLPCKSDERSAYDEQNSR